MDEVKKHQNRVLAHLTPNRETEINALWKGSFQMLKTPHKKKGLKGDKVEYLAILWQCFIIQRAPYLGLWAKSQVHDCNLDPSLQQWPEELKPKVGV